MAGRKITFHLDVQVRRAGLVEHMIGIYKRMQTQRPLAFTIILSATSLSSPASKRYKLQPSFRGPSAVFPTVTMILLATDFSNLELIYPKVIL